MDINLIKTKDGFVAFSLFPVGIVGWGKSEKECVLDIGDNLYDFCNWLSLKLPKDPNVTIIAKFTGEISAVNFSQDDGRVFKKYAEIVLQTAFSFKCMVDGARLSSDEKQRVETVFSELGIIGGVGIIEFASSIADGGDFRKARAFIYKIYRLAKELFFDVKNQAREITDSFKFSI